MIDNEYFKRLKGVKPINISYRMLTTKELADELHPLITEAIYRITHPTEEEKNNLKKIAEDAWDFEWEVRLNNKKDETNVE